MPQNCAIVQAYYMLSENKQVHIHIFDQLRSPKEMRRIYTHDLLAHFT